MNRTFTSIIKLFRRSGFSFLGRLPAGRTRRVAACGVFLAGAGAGAAAQSQTLTNNGARLIVQAGATVVVRGSMTSATGSTLANAGTVRLTGNFTNAGTVAPTGWLVFDGTTDQTLSAGPASLAQVEVNNAGATGQNRLLVPADVTITQRLRMTLGLARTLAATYITLPAGAVIEGAGPKPGLLVQGNLRIVRTNVTGVTNFGNGIVLDATGTSLGTVTATSTAGLAAAGVSYAASANGPAKSIDRIWSIASTVAPTKAVPLTFSWPGSDDNGQTDFVAAKVWQQQADGSGWFTTMAPVSAATRSISTTATTFTRWTVSNGANPLPVELARFSAERQGDGAWLRWATAAERDNHHFDVESSTDGRQFRRIATVASRGTAGRGATYEAPDPNLARYGAETVYYRLRQVDRDRTETYSPVRTLALAVAAPVALRLQAYPNPFGAALTVAPDAAAAGTATLVLRDATGRAVWQQGLGLARGANTYAVPLAPLPAGVYLLTVTQGAQQRHLTLTHE